MKLCRYEQEEELWRRTFMQANDDDADDDDDELKAVLNGCIRKITNNTSKGITSKTTENEDKEEAGLYLRAGNSASGERYVGLLVNTLFLVVNEGIDMKPQMAYQFQWCYQSTRLVYNVNRFFILVNERAQLSKAKMAKCVNYGPLEIWNYVKLDVNLAMDSKICLFNACHC